MNDRQRIENLIRHLDDLRAGDAPGWQIPIREVAIRALEEELERLSRRLRRHRDEGLVA